ncbi:MAG TPA: VOC family protein [Acidimicrobiales bacterium]|jgi:catechol 2,3-dioxygenase-like lactoylglutathione lyase family enzyme
MAEFTSPHRLNHAAYVTWDTAATVAFYRDVMGMRLISYATAEEVPSTAEKNHFLHTFFEMTDGGCIAFFEIEGLPPEEVETPVPRWARHIALSVDSEEELMSALRHLKGHHIDVTGPVDHEGIWTSLYFFDPNGIRLEITYQNRKFTDEDSAKAYKDVDAWLAEHGNVKA